jgi:lipopolysaccharide biosynthesis regulator YciM
MALLADTRGQPQQAEQDLQRALEAAPSAVRARLLSGQRQAAAGEHAQALRHWDELLAQHPAAWPLVAPDYARSAKAINDRNAARERLGAAYAAEPDTDLLRARLELEDDPAQRRRMVQQHLQLQPTLSAAAQVLQLPLEQWDADTLAQLHKVVADCARPLQRYRCAACGFEAHHFFWQCPGCQGWDTYPPRRMESL